ncbi:hypothetical protein [Actinomyces ruminis]|uniref:hypothetical protein n=1 Tax=Actinomyces ruminis TaxID=1937003 RepID=UPI0015D4A749|nr:hypothetical protein [Actinomyces ruminis]
MSTASLEDRLVRVASTSSTATITVYDISGDDPEQLWETTQDVTDTVVWPALWDRQIIIENTFIDIDSQARSDAPWDADASVTIMSNGAVACVDTTCQFWSSPSQKLWETEFPTDAAVEMWYSLADDYSIVSSIEYEDFFVVDLKTGNMNRLDGEKYALPYKLNDGWLTYEGDGSTEPPLFTCTSSTAPPVIHSNPTTGTTSPSILGRQRLSLGSRLGCGWKTSTSLGLPPPIRSRRQTRTANQSPSTVMTSHSARPMP